MPLTPQSAPIIIVNTSLDMQRLHVAELPDGQECLVLADRSFWVLNKASTLTQDGQNLLAPFSGSPIAGAATALWARQFPLSVPLPLVVTTDATPNATSTIAIPDNSVVQLDVIIVARDAVDGESAGYRIVGTVKRHAAGAATLVGTPVALLTNEDDAGWAAALGVSGTNAVVTVTGAAADTIVWEIVATQVRLITTV